MTTTSTTRMASAGYSGTTDAHLKRLRRVGAKSAGGHGWLSGTRTASTCSPQSTPPPEPSRPSPLALPEEHLAHCIANTIRAVVDDAGHKITTPGQAAKRVSQR